MTINQYFRRFIVVFGTVAAVALVASIPAWSQTTDVQARLGLRAVSNDDIAAYKLPSTTQRSGGLTTIGLGQPAYLEALVNIAIPESDIGGVTWTIAKKPQGSAAMLEDSPIGLSVPSYEPSVNLAARVAARTMLRPDVVGRYTVTASISVSGAGTKDVSIDITAGTYVGIAGCGACHSLGIEGTKFGMLASWSKTSHSKIFKDGMDGVASSHYGPSCLGCHTVGYDTNAKAANGAFDDIAARLKWMFPSVLQPGTYDAAPEELKNVGNIQCENCHGPGSQHAANGGNPAMISVSLDSGTCGQCHGALSHHFKSAEWANSVHAIATSYPSGAGREGCVGCHTAGGFLARLKGATFTPTNYTPINCQLCHEPHGRTFPGNNAHLLRTLDPVRLQDGTMVTEGGRGQLCMNCHQSRRNAAEYAANDAPSAHFGPHYGTQADMLAGANGFTYGAEIPSSAHGAVVEDTCVGCHMQAVAEKDPAFTKAGGHTFKPKSADGAELVKECQTCHGPRLTTFNFRLLDYDGDGAIDGVQTEVEHLLDQLSALLPPAGEPKTSLAINSTWTRPQLEAAYNWKFVHDDGSFGIHNMAYATGLLKASIADLKTAPK